jgi:hypothetical protein
MLFTIEDIEAKEALAHQRVIQAHDQDITEYEEKEYTSASSLLVRILSAPTLTFPLRLGRFHDKTPNLRKRLFYRALNEHVKGPVAAHYQIVIVHDTSGAYECYLTKVDWCDLSTIITAVVIAAILVMFVRHFYH